MAPGRGQAEPALQKPARLLAVPNLLSPPPSRALQRQAGGQAVTQPQPSGRALVPRDRRPPDLGRWHVALPTQPHVQGGPEGPARCPLAGLQLPRGPTCPLPLLSGVGAFDGAWTTCCDRLPPESQRQKGDLIVGREGGQWLFPRGQGEGGGGRHARPHLLHSPPAHRFLGSDDPDTFFTCTHRHQIVSGGPTAVPMPRPSSQEPAGPRTPESHSRCRRPAGG